MNGEFDKLIPKLADITKINTTAKIEHVPEIERKIRNIKDRSRAIKVTLPYKILPNAMKNVLVIHVILWINAWPAKTGVSDELSSREIVLCWQLNTKLH